MGSSDGKILNDPVHGFISIPCGLPRRIVDHPHFQRLRRIQQLGITQLVYPGAVHTRFQHAIGAMHLMQVALEALHLKGHQLTGAERTAALAAILLHDIGHGPYSHCLEGQLLPGTGHEHVGLRIMQRINQELGGELDEAIAIFTHQHPKTFLHQLLSGQLDVDRMDYLLRDSFFTGVVEGRIPGERLIKMLRVADNQLAVEIKGLYSVESFLLARRVMYWQVYLHKTVVAAELLLKSVIGRARALTQSGHHVLPQGPLARLLARPATHAEAIDDEALNDFLDLNDSDIDVAIKQWTQHDDPTLQQLSHRLLHRQLPRLLYSDSPIEPSRVEELRQQYTRLHPDLPQELIGTLIRSGMAQNSAYNSHAGAIQLIDQQGHLASLPQLSRIISEHYLQQRDTRYYLLAPKEILPTPPPSSALEALSH